MNLPVYIPIVFFISVLLTIVLFLNAIRNSISKGSFVVAIISLILWLITQGLLSYNNVYVEDLAFLPPKIFLFGVLPWIVIFFILFKSKKGKAVINSVSVQKLSYINIVRIPIEFVLLWLSTNQKIPKELTFEGINFDIVMGITTPLIVFFGFIKPKISRKVLLVWNIIGVFLLTLVFALAILSAPFPMQQFGFNQPNIGLLEFPYAWLPTFIVPIVFLGHFISIKRLWK